MFFVWTCTETEYEMNKTKNKYSGGGGGGTPEKNLNRVWGMFMGFQKGEGWDNGGF